MLSKRSIFCSKNLLLYIKTITVLMVVILCVNIQSSSCSAENQKNISVFLNEDYIKINPVPILMNNRTFVPIKSIADAFYAETFWDSETNTVTIKNTNIELNLKIKSKIASVKNANEVKSFLMDVEPFIIKGRTFVPIRFICDAFNCDIVWDNTNKKIDIITNFKMEVCQTDYGEKDKEKLSFINMNSRVETELFSDYFIDNAVWSNDNQYLCLITGRIDKIKLGKLIINNITHKKIRIFEVKTGKEIILEDEYYDGKYSERRFKWIDNENVLIMKTRNRVNSKIKDIQYIFNVKTKEWKAINENYMENFPLQENIHQVKKNYELSDKTITLTYINSLDKTKALFSNKNYEIFLLDINNNTKEFLFKGIEVQWSPKENIARYSLPKEVERINQYPAVNFESKDLETYLYDFRDKSNIKIADFNAKLFFSDDENYIAYVPRNYFGLLLV